MDHEALAAELLAAADRAEPVALITERHPDARAVGRRSGRGSADRRNAGGAGRTADRVVVAPPYPPAVQNTYSERCAGPRGITVLDAIECWLHQHGLRHTGEIEMVRGFFGLGGVTA